MNVNIFQKYRLLARIIVNLFVILAIDITAGITYKKINGYAWFSAWEGSILPIEQVISESSYRIHSNRYHHDLAKNVDKKII